ncbi:Protein SGT1 [Galdieria sulphuraria]|nr:Protein SGT1 [Galdieria sulphuraria]
MSQKSLFREDWFQNGSFVSLTLYIKDVDRDESNVTFTQQTVTVNLFSARDKSIYEQTWELSHPVVAEQSLVTYFPQKVELKMKKKEEGLLWKQLTSGATLKSSDNTQSSYSSRETASLQSGRFPKQFAVEEDDDEEQDQSKDLLAFFRDIYEKSDEDTRRAMVKSFVESQGKVLSTDWKKVSSQNSRYDNE